MSYEDRFGEDWSPAELEPDEALERAFALGVAVQLGREPGDELDRLRSVVSSKYDDTMLDLAFEEGRREAARVQRDGGKEGEAVWDALLEGELIEPEPPERESGEGHRDDLPEALRALSLETTPEDSRDALGLLDCVQRR